MNAAIELHDSRVMRVRLVASDVVLDIDAYVHVSEGEPGVDEGTGWTRLVQLTIRNAAIRSGIASELLIYSGRVRIGEKSFNDMLPLELDFVGDVAIELFGGEGTLSITGNAIRIVPLARPATSSASRARERGTTDPWTPSCF